MTLALLALHLLLVGVLLPRRLAGSPPRSSPTCWPAPRTRDRRGVRRGVRRDLGD
ncbi:hypothetical protein [Kitasatospora purpeofusca]|uniref:hypothetical protein n=1 Tax=Kitasatospora purpeofusca TaxID=67352 RepID=UPI003870D35F|nr:hypothetical protein OIP63_32230 [Kitasatospora purpeofusca]